jgi:hypothetical protein
MELTCAKASESVRPSACASGFASSSRLSRKGAKNGCARTGGTSGEISALLLTLSHGFTRSQRISPRLSRDQLTAQFQTGLCNSLRPERKRV